MTGEIIIMAERIQTIQVQQKTTSTDRKEPFHLKPSQDTSEI